MTNVHTLGKWGKHPTGMLSCLIYEITKMWQLIIYNLGVQEDIQLGNVGLIKVWIHIIIDYHFNLHHTLTVEINFLEFDEFFQQFVTILFKSLLKNISQKLLCTCYAIKHWLFRKFKKMEKKSDLYQFQISVESISFLFYNWYWKMFYQNFERKTVFVRNLQTVHHVS